MIEGDVGTINTHGGPSRHLADEWGKWLAGFVDDEHLDVVLLQEMTPAHLRAAAKHLGDDWAIVCRNEWPGADDNAVLVRKDWSRLAGHAVRRMGRHRWAGNFVRRLHDPRSLTSALCRNGLTAASSHAPPGVDSKPVSRRQRNIERIVRRLTGKPDRVRAWIGFWRRVEQWGTNRNRKGGLWILGLDANERFAVPGEWTPKAVARRLHATTAAAGIDGFIASDDLELSNTRTHDPGPGMDHHPVTTHFKERI